MEYLSYFMPVVGARQGGARNDGLVVAEIELASEDETINHPEWVGKEVTDDPKYFNSSLISKPFSTW